MDERPDGVVLECATMPRLSRGHVSRLRSLWALGRPAHLTALTGVDLDLEVHGLVARVNGGFAASAVLTVTKAGVIHLNKSRQAQIEGQRAHHSLGQRLAAHLREKGFLTWENLEFANPREQSDRAWGVVRPDVFACLPSLRARNAAPAIYEVKVNRADFLADMAKPEKRQAYGELAEAVYYCCPDGLIGKQELPDGAGLLCETAEGGFELRRKARRARGFVLAVDTAMTLMVKRQVPLSDMD